MKKKTSYFCHLKSKLDIILVFTGLPASFELLRDLVYNIIYTRTYTQVLNSPRPNLPLPDPQLSKTNT